MRPGTLCLPQNNGKLLLGLKKRGFGAGKWNGFGGKIHEGEMLEAAAIRELREEAGIEAQEEDLHRAALLKFRSANPELNWDVHVFTLTRWQGKPQETEEMRPEWFAEGDIPYDAMWVDDRYWLPEVLAGRRIEAEFEFNSDGSVFIRHAIKNLSHE